MNLIMFYLSIIFTYVLVSKYYLLGLCELTSVQNHLMFGVLPESKYYNSQYLN